MIHVIDSSVATDNSFYGRLISLVQPQLDFLGPIIAEHYAKKLARYARASFACCYTPPPPPLLGHSLADSQCG